jgi:hypothetical protein
MTKSNKKGSASTPITANPRLPQLERDAIIIYP